MKKIKLSMKFMMVLMFCSPPIAATLWKSLHLPLYVIGIGFIPLLSVMLLAVLHGVLTDFGLRFKPLELFSCWIGWHWTIDKKGVLGASEHGVCVACGQAGMFDSRGNFFV